LEFVQSGSARAIIAAEDRGGGQVVALADLQERRELHTQADYDALFAAYERDNLPKQGEALAKIRTWVASGHCVALTCYEAEPCQCHRHCVAEALEREFGTKFSPQHL
jgi:uncharacterized protein (DUF488 family)